MSHSKKFHIGKNGPAVCRAEKKGCPIGGQHFENMAEAENAYVASRGDDEKPLTKTKKKIPQVEKAPVGSPRPMVLSPATQELLSTLQEHDIRPILVGGCIRDHFLGKESKDIDLELYGTNPDGDSLDFDRVTTVLQGSGKGFKVDETGKSFSVVKVFKDKEDFDLALPRKEQTTGMGHKDYEVEFDSRMPFEEAASRRDFTINAMGYDGKDYIDPYGGRRDLEKRVLRHVSPAFADDPLRVLRGMNFAARFNMTMDPDTTTLCQSLAPHAKTLPKERIEQEFQKLFTKGTNCAKGFEVLHDTGWGAQLPGFKDCSRDELVRYGNTIDKVPKTLRMAVLHQLMKKDSHEPATKVVTLSESERSRAVLFSKLAETSSMAERRAVHRAYRKKHSDPSNAELTKALKSVGASGLEGIPEQPDSPRVTGDYLMEHRGMVPGRELGSIMKRSQQVQDEHPEWTVDQILQEVDKNL